MKLISILLFASLIFSFQNTDFLESPVVGFWNFQESPEIIVCDFIVPLEKVKNATKFWEKLGYKFSEVRLEKSLDECFSAEPKYGQIRIRMINSNEILEMNNMIAMTRLRSNSKNFNILSADIIVHGFISQKELALEHEIGHALGWKHTNVRGHIMNPVWEKIGEISKGMKYSDYCSQIYSLLR